jgi:hypothetical protein
MFAAAGKGVLAKSTNSVQLGIDTLGTVNSGNYTATAIVIGAYL